MSRKIAGEKIFNILTAQGCAPVALPDKEVWDWQQRWRAIYAKELYAETGKWVLHGYDWHVFSYDKHTHKQGDRAWSEYRRLGQTVCSFLVLSAYIHQTYGFSCVGKLTERLDRGEDIIVAPPSLEWTMSFNHEHYGPYFAVP